MSGIDIAKLFKDPKAYLIGVVLVFAGEKVWGYIEKGAEVDFKTAIQTQVKIGLRNPEIINELTENKAFVDMFFESKTVKLKIAELSEEMNREIRNAIIEDISRQDTHKISTRAEISRRLNIREENYFSLLEKTLRAVLKKENASKKDVRVIIKKNIKPSAIKVPVF